jgi:hypothetical protein
MNGLAPVPRSPTRVVAGLITIDHDDHVHDYDFLRTYLIALDSWRA